VVRPQKFGFFKAKVADFIFLQMTDGRRDTDVDKSGQQEAENGSFLVYFAQIVLNFCSKSKLGELYANSE